ncbi:MAG: cytochrome C [Deltaproteobacteria bacterium HGW-Deltaproteobacteria-14]|nr:MAG: cytochrome C [Deltaproteobacteria bacterium HGW-Deltaproteobacteria-14]
MSKFSSWMPRLWSHWLSLVGVILTSIAGLSLFISFIIGVDNVYASAFLWLIMPGVFLFGLALIPIGLWRSRVRKRKGGAASEEVESVSRAVRELLARPLVRRRLLLVLGATLANVVILAAAGQAAISFMDTPKFCGTVCHEVMQPEYDAYLRSPHARVPCVDCHIGPGASFFVKSKLDGLRQVWGVITDDFSRPIPSPIHDLRPARDTCEECHWPARFTGNRVKFITHHEDDAESSPKVTTVMLKIGGEDRLHNRHTGIHWHVDPDIQVVYEALDDHRDSVGDIMVMRDGVPISVYKAPGEPKPVVELRTMDCVDCHNRPTHIYDETPERAVDAALVSGELDRSVPWIRSLAVALLQRTDRAREGVEAAFEEDLAAAYDAEHADEKPAPEVIKRSAAAIAALYLRNIYPKMKVQWDTYRSQLGHREIDGKELGCFRCHDESHTRQDGQTLSQDCDLCHELLSEDEAPEDLSPALKSAYLGR